MLVVYYVPENNWPDWNIYSFFSRRSDSISHKDCFLPTTTPRSVFRCVVDNVQACIGIDTSVSFLKDGHWWTSMVIIYATHIFLQIIFLLKLNSWTMGNAFSGTHYSTESSICISDYGLLKTLLLLSTFYIDTGKVDFDRIWKMCVKTRTNITMHSL